jgi:tetratricopeptide (TPR) repeat protein
MIPLLFLLWHALIQSPRAERAQELGTLLDAVQPYVRGEENSYPPAPDDILKADYESEDATLLRDSVASFFKGEYETARKGLTSLETELPAEGRLLPLLGATHLREGNFSLARDYYTKSLRSPPAGPDSKSICEVGLALALFNLMELENALPHAKGAYEDRLKRKGAGDPETMSAANVLSGTLIGLGMFHDAEGILEGTVLSALSSGLDPDSPLAVDSLNLLSLSYRLSSSSKDVFSLLGDPTPLKEEPPVPSTGSILLVGDEHGEGDPATGTGGTGQPQGSAPGQAGQGPAARAAYDFPAALSLYNDLTKLTHRSPLRAELLTSMIMALAPNRNLCEDPGDVAFRGSLWYLCLDLADSLTDAYYPPGTLGFAESLIAWKELAHDKRAYLVYEMAALYKASEGDSAKAEAYLRQGLGKLHIQETLAPHETAYLALRSITLADLILAQGKPPIEAEIELMAAVTTLERAVPRKERETSFELPFLYWYLARYLRDQGRNSDSKSNFQKAEKAVAQLSKQFPERDAELSRLSAMIKEDAAFRAGRKGGAKPNFPNSPRIFFQAYIAEGGRAREKFQPPAVMRVELESLKFLGRAGEFGPMIQRALAGSPPDSRDRLLYESLNLKYLEETGNDPALFAELQKLYENPKGQDDDSRAVFRSAVRAYEGRIREARGDISGARAAYASALGLLPASPGHEDRKAELRKALAALEALGLPEIVEPGQGQPSAPQPNAAQPYAPQPNAAQPGPMAPRPPQQAAP